MVRPAPELAGLIEVSGLGIRRCEFVAEAVVGLVVDLAAADAERLPPPEALEDPNLTVFQDTQNSRRNRLSALATRCRCTDHDRKFIFPPTFGRLCEGNW